MQDCWRTISSRVLDCLSFNFLFVKLTLFTWIGTFSLDFAFVKKLAFLVNFLIWIKDSCLQSISKSCGCQIWRYTWLRDWLRFLFRTVCLDWHLTCCHFFFSNLFLILLLKNLTDTPESVRVYAHCRLEFIRFVTLSRSLWAVQLVIHEILCQVGVKSVVIALSSRFKPLVNSELFFFWKPCLVKNLNSWWFNYFFNFFGWIIWRLDQNWAIL